MVSFVFVTGFVAKTQAPSLLLGLRASLYRPNQCETIAMGDYYILCGRSGVTWSASAAHCQLCERFSFAVVTGVLSLGHGTVCFVSFELGSLVLLLRLFFVKNFALILVEARECGSRALPCEATWEQPLLGFSQSSTGSV